MTSRRTNGLDLAGLRAGPAQTWGAIRLVPLLRDEPITDLRLHPRCYDRDEVGIVEVGSRTSYVSYVPHAFVATWSADGSPVAAYGTQLRDPAVVDQPASIGLRFHRRMARREDRRRLRFLPLHLALEGYLELQFGGPPIAWQEWAKNAVTQGLSPRVEAAYRGAWLPGLDDALRVFEIHPDQCGMVLYVADALAAAFVVPHPGDYRTLHPTLLQDLYGELVYHYTYMYPKIADFSVRLDPDRVETVAELRSQIERARRDWSTFHGVMAQGLLGGRTFTFMPVFQMGRFILSRFLPDFDPNTENHLGEIVTDAAGKVAYLKTFRLSAAQTRRGHLLSRLAVHDWDLDANAVALGTDRPGLVLRLDRAGFGHLLRPEIIDACRNQARRSGHLTPARRAAG